MLKKLLVVSFLLICSTAVFGQNHKPKNRLPAGIAFWSGADSDTFLNIEIIKSRLKSLLGKKNYASFMDSFETANPIEKKGSILFSSGCMIHACGHLESAVAIDLAGGTIHAAIYNEVRKTKYFNENGSKTPKRISNWAKRLKSMHN